jgi:hypothetical protein
MNTMKVGEFVVIRRSACERSQRNQQAHEEPNNPLENAKEILFEGSRMGLDLYRVNKASLEKKFGKEVSVKRFFDPESRMWNLYVV